MLQVVVEIEQGFLWSYKGFYVSSKVFMENRNLAVTNQIPTSDKYDLSAFLS